MTKTDIERIAVLEQKVTDVCDKIDGLDKKLDSFIDSAENKFAQKWIEWFIKAWILGLITVGTGFVIYVAQSFVK